MSLETIVSKMIAANEPESNIAKVIKYHKKDSSKINCKKCNHSWKVADGGDDLYMCHECGYNNNKSPLKATAAARRIWRMSFIPPAPPVKPKA